MKPIRRKKVEITNEDGVNEKKYMTNTRERRDGKIQVKEMYWRNKVE